MRPVAPFIFVQIPLLGLLCHCNVYEPSTVGDTAFDNAAGAVPGQIVDAPEIAPTDVIPAYTVTVTALEAELGLQSVLVIMKSVV